MPLKAFNPDLKEHRLIPTNGERADRAAKALTFYRRTTHGRAYAATTPVFRENVVDLIGDLLHFAHREGFNPEAVLRCAQMHFEDETNLVNHQSP